MRIFSVLLSFILVPFVVHAFVVPERPTGFVQDFAKILTDEQVTQLETTLQFFEKNTTNEIAVVTIQSLDGDAIENVAQEIFTKWGIGKKDKNNGVLLLVSLSDRKTRIHTGYGVEGDLTDIGTSYIQREVITPAFRDEDYFGGLNGAVDKMIIALGGNNIVPENYSEKPKSKINYEFIFIIGFIILQFVAAVLGKSKSWWHGGVLGGLVGGGIIWYFAIISLVSGALLIVFPVLLGLLFDYIVSKGYQKGQATGHYPWFIGGGGSGGGSGGGFGGFGGGGSGGGGSSGSW